MKTEFTEVSETRKHLAFEVPPDVLEAEISRVARGYSRSAKVPGFRPGKVPATVVRQRYREQILYDVAHDLIPRLVGDALKERNLDPVSTPDIRDVVIEEGKPLTFTADFETLPPIEPGDYSGISLRRPAAVLDVGAVDAALEHLQQRAARWHPIEDRPAAVGDTMLMDMTRTRRTRLVQLAGPTTPLAEDEKPESLPNVSVEIGATANPPGFDDHLLGASVGDERSFTISYAADYAIQELAGATVDYTIVVKGLRRKELLPLDDEFAREVSDLETLGALRDRLREDMQLEKQHEADHKVRHDLLRELSARLRTAPEALVEQEIDRRLEEFARRLLEQGIDPTKASVDWQDFRERQRDAASETVRSTLVLDEISRREGVEAGDEDVAKEIERFAERSGHTAAAVRARLEKEGAIERIRAGLVREKTMALLLEKAVISQG
jgi:trigger factor